MAWINSYTVSTGDLHGERLLGDGDFSQVTWSTSPDPDSNVFKNCTGDCSRLFDGTSCKGVLFDKQALDEFVLWGLDVNQSDYFKVQLIYKGRCTGMGATANFEFSLLKRVWTDAHTFTDTNITNVLVSLPTFYVSSPYILTERINTLAFVSTSNNTKYIFFGLCWLETNIPTGTATRHINGYALDYNKLSTLLGGDIPSGEVSPEFGPASLPDGGYNPESGHGTFDDSSDEIPVPSLPTVGVTSAGFVNVYKIETGDLQSLGEKLFPHFLPAEILADPSQLTTPDVLTMMIKTLYGALISPVGTSVQLADNLGIIDVLMNGKLIDYILDCHIIPTSISGATIEGLRVGYRQFNDLQLAKCTTDYVEIDCGSLSIAEYWGNFLDYSCTVKLFLPFVGFVPIENEYWNSGTIKVVYHFNVVDGSFQVYVIATSGKSKLTNSVIGQYGGVCCVHLPITGLQYSNVVAGLVNGTGGAIEKAMGGNVAGAVTNALNMSMLRPDAPMSNGYNASSSFLSERFPYLVIERPKAQFSQAYPTERGLPLNVAMKLSSVHGFTTVENPVLDIACSDAEYNEIVSLLKNGVILP